VTTRCRSAARSRPLTPLQTGTGAGPQASTRRLVHCCLYCIGLGDDDYYWLVGWNGYCSSWWKVWVAHVEMMSDVV
jgi:hypothetical protein